MPIPVECGSCGASYTLADAMAGKRVRCRECEKTIRVPSEEEDSEESSEPEVRRPLKKRKKRKQSSNLPWILLGLLVGVVAIIGGTMVAIGLAKRDGAAAGGNPFAPAVPAAAPLNPVNPADDSAAIAQAYPNAEEKVSLSNLRKAGGQLNIDYTVTAPEQPQGPGGVPGFRPGAGRGGPMFGGEQTISGRVSAVVRVQGQWRETVINGITWTRQGTITLQSVGGANSALPTGAQLFLVQDISGRKRISNIVTIP